jgi:hypothetical protein
VAQNIFDQDVITQQSKELQRHQSERLIHPSEYQLVESQHIPYDALQLEMLRRLRERQGLPNDEKSQLPCIHDELKKLSDIDTKELMLHVDKLRNKNSLKTLKMVRELSEV